MSVFMRLLYTINHNENENEKGSHRPRSRHGDKYSK